MKKYLIALDLDDTLLTKEKIIPQTTKDYLKQLIDDGHKVVLATGRPYAGMSMYYEELNLDTPIVTSNGAMTFNPKDPNFKKVLLGIDKELIKDVFINTKECVVDAFFGYEKRIYLTNENEIFKYFIHYQDDSIVIKGNVEDIIDINPGSVIVGVKEDYLKTFEKYVEDNHKDNLLLRLFGVYNKIGLYELYSNKISKREGLQLVLNHYNMNKENLIAIGDGHNDIEMLDYAYVGVAMVNAKQDVLDSAKYITREDSNKEGVILFLDHFLGYNTLK